MSSWRRVVTVEPLIGIHLLATYCLFEIDWRFERYFKGRAEWTIDKWTTQIVSSTIPIILVLFFGSYSDKFNRRKPFLLLPIFGQIVTLLGYTLCMVFENQCPSSLMTVLQCVPFLYGGRNLLYMAAFALIADISSPSTISFRIGIVYIVERMAMLIGHSVDVDYLEGYMVGHHYSVTHWVLVSGTGAILLVAMFYGLFWIKEPKPSSDTLNSSFIRNLFHPKNFLETATSLIRQYNGRTRVYIFILLHLISTYTLVNFGSFYSVLHSGNIIVTRMTLMSFWLCSSIGALVIVPLFTKCLTLDDTKLLILGCVSQILSNVLTVAPYIQVLYLASIIGIFYILTIVISTSMVLKLTSPNHFGKAAAIVTIFDSSGSSFALMIIEFFNNSFKFVYFGAILFAILLLLVVWMHIDYRKNKNIQQPRNDSIVNNEEYEEDQL